MINQNIRLAAWLLFCLVFVTPTHAGTLSGTVRNGTTGAVVPNQDVILIQLQGGMQSAGTFRTDARGRYTMNHPAIGQAPVLVRVQYHGVNYHQNVPPGTAVADIVVYDSTSNFGALQVAQRIIVLQPNGAVLLMGEEFSVHNDTKPPVAIFKEDGSFLFDVPAGAELGQVSAAGPSGMPLVQGTIDKGNGRFAIAFPIRPGENNVRVSYQIPYAKNEVTVRLSSPYAAQRVVLVVPPTMTVSGEGFAAAGSEQGFNLFARDTVPANTPFAFSVSGTAPPPSADSAPQGAPDTGAAISTLPGRLDHLKWVLLGGIAALFALGALFLWKRPIPQVAPAVGAPLAEISEPRKSPAVAGDKTADAIVAQVMESASRSATQNLEAIKDALFRLELRRQAGTISQGDYTRELASTQQKLRELLGE
jgi:hypothetical protein